MAATHAAVRAKTATCREIRINKVLSEEEKKQEMPGGCSVGGRRPEDLAAVGHEGPDDLLSTGGSTVSTGGSVCSATRTPRSLNTSSNPDGENVTSIRACSERVPVGEAAG